MNGERRQKIKSVLAAVPPGALVDTRWMRRHQVADSLYHDYVQRGWFVRLARGLLLRPNGAYDPQKPLDWQVVAASMHQVMGIRFHVGGMAALNLQGYAHYLPMGDWERVTLYADKLPGWLAKIRVEADFTMRSLKLFSDPNLGVKLLRNSGFSFGSDAVFPISTPERAVLEELDELPDGAGFDHLDMIFQGLVGLSPDRLMSLLRDCRRVKVTRLFFAFADRHRHAWLNYLDKGQLNFGRGDRQLVKGGRTHPTYRITLPAPYATTSGGEDHA